MVLECQWKDILAMLNSCDSSKISQFFYRMNRIKRISIFKHLSEPQLLIFARLMKKEKFKINTEIIIQKSIGNKFYFIDSGRVAVYQDEKL